MATQSDPFPKIALRWAKSPDVARLFAQLADRAEAFAQMYEEFTESIARNRAAREGRPVRLTKWQQQFLDQADRDAENAEQEIDRLAASMDDAALLSGALSDVDLQIQHHEYMLSAFHEDDKPIAMRLLDFQRQTMRLIEQFVESSPFRGSVTSMWRKQNST